MSRKTLAIVSSYNESCGNASYTHVLRNAFQDHVDVTVIPLDLFLLQRSGEFFSRHGDRHIQQIAEKLKGFDYVNIQFEAGLYGKEIGAVFRRIKVLIKACKNLVLTMHRIDLPELTDKEILRKVVGLKLHPRNVFKIRKRQHHATLYKQIIDFCRSESQAGRNVWIAVHTRREHRIIADLYGMEKVFDFPITFLKQEERKAILESTALKDFRDRYQIPEGVKVIGLFGFISGYKGYETTFNALQLLPNNYHVYIFGGQHPQSLKANVPIDPYFQSLFKMIEDYDAQQEAKNNEAKRKLLPRNTESAFSRDDIGNEVDGRMINRIRFVGSVPDSEFIEALRFSDYTVLPYQEVGQSMSGVIALAIESGANLFCTTNHSFNEVRKYYGDVFEVFDVGNYIELAQKLRLPKKDFSKQRDDVHQKYNIENNVRKHLEVLGYSE